MMTSKTFKGKLVSLKYTDKKEIVYGFVLDYADDWTLMKHNPYGENFELDGYILLRHKNLKGYRYDEKEKFKEKIIKLKGLPYKKDIDLPLTDLAAILQFISANYGVFSFETRSDKTFYVGKLAELNSRQLIIDFLDAYGEWTEQRKFRPGDLRIIQFDNDYIKSLMLVAEDNARQNQEL